jgi:hypothetical protein
MSLLMIFFYYVKKGTLYNYADDNTLSYGHPDFNVLTSVLESESNVLINWFKVNKMQANPDKFQVLAIGKKTFDKNATLGYFLYKEHVYVPLGWSDFTS